MRITEVDGHLDGQGDLSVLGQLCSLILGQGFSQTLGQSHDGCQQAITNGDGTVIAGKIESSISL
jgi:hypothetical protein